MAKVITFSRQYPSYHPKKGEPTYFVEKLINSITNHDYKRGELVSLFNYDAIHSDDNVALADYKICASSKPKHHTIRAGNRFKVGDKFSPRVWSMKPYKSKQISITAEMEIKKIWDFEIKIVEVDGGFASKGFIDGGRVSPDKLMTVAENDGLELADFLSWFQFPKSFKGQIICWNENIIY